MAASSMIKKSILVVGNGWAGSQITAELAKTGKYEVTVLTPFDFQESIVQMTRIVASGPQDHEKAIFDLVREDGVEYIFGYCTALSANSATVSTGKTIPFDVCIVATGQRAPIFTPDIENETTAAARKAAIASVHGTLQTASTVVVSGGGVIGTEVAADIKLRYKDKRVIVVHPHSSILNQLPVEHQQFATKTLEKHGVEFILGVRVLGFDAASKMVTLSTGEKIECQSYIPTGSPGGSGSFLPASSLDEKKYIKVNEFLQVKDLPTIFAIGDCSDNDIKIAVKIQVQKPTILTNIDKLLKGQPLVVHNKKSGGLFGQLTGPIMVALGHSHPEAVGMLNCPPGTFCGCFCWTCCCCGGPCSIPAGKMLGKAKSDFNLSIKPIKGKGLDKA